MLRIRPQTLAATVGVTVALGSCASSLSSLKPASGPPPRDLQPLPAGAGWYLAAVPQGEKLPSNFFGKPVSPKVVAGFSGVPVTSKWWSSLIWEFDRAGHVNPYSENMYPHPLTVRAGATGLELGYAATPVIEKSAYNYWFKDDLLIGIQGLEARETRVESFGDWTVTAAWDAGEVHLRATMGRGLPYAYFTATGGTVTVTIKSAPPGAVWHNRDGMVGVTVGEQHYAVFAPSGSEWELSGRVLSSKLAGKDYLSVAALPDRTEDTLKAFRAHAFAFVKGSHVDWAVDPTLATVTTTYSLDIEPKETGGVNVAEPLMALYRHQWLRSDASFTPWTYVSPRGPMKVMAGHTFHTATKYVGVLPLLPPPTQPSDREKIVGALSEAVGSDDWYPVGPDWKYNSYWDGKSLQRIATLARIADALGERDLRDRFVAGLERGLEDWFDGVPPRAFYYDRTWHALTPTPGGFGTAAELNDHHFHFGYFIQAAAAVAQFDPPWARKYGPFVELLAADAASFDRASTQAPFLRYYDAYAGHSWASGTAAFDEGNNEESSSEDANFAAGLVLWGAQTDNRKLRDAGLWMLSTEADAIEQYWFDVDGAVFPKGYSRPLIAMLWDNGGRYNTWWDPEPIFVHGINVLPLTASSLYLGRRPDIIERNYEYLVKVNRGDPLLWRDILWKDLALADAKRARKLYEEHKYFSPDLGESRANLMYWFAALGDLGRVDASVTADAPTAVAFLVAGARTHVAYNPAATAARVRFSDDVIVDVPPGGTRTRVAPAGP
jgi:endoglucanase Acf2